MSAVACAAVCDAVCCRPCLESAGFGQSGSRARRSCPPSTPASSSAPPGTHSSAQRPQLSASSSHSHCGQRGRFALMDAIAGAIIGEAAGPASWLSSSWRLEAG